MGAHVLPSFALSPSPPPTQILIVQLFRCELQLLRAPSLAAFFYSQANIIASTLQCHIAYLRLTKAARVTRCHYTSA